MFRACFTTPVASLALGSLTLACASTPPPQPLDPTPQPVPSRTANAATEKPPFDAKKMMARELPQLPPVHPLKAPDGSWSLEAPSLAPPELEKEEKDSVKLSLSLGTEAPLVCRVYAELIDAGATFAAAMQSNDSRIQFRAVSPITLETVKTVPITFVRGVYLLDKDGEKAAGELKVAVASHHSWTLNCHHDELGYEETMVRIVKTMVETFKPKDEVLPRYASLSIARLGDLPVGFERFVVRAHDKATTIVHEHGLLMFPKTKTHFGSMDFTIAQLVNNMSGRLVRGAWVTAVDGKLNLNAQLEHQKWGKHSVGGQRQGKKIEASFVTKDRKAIPGMVLRDRKLRAKLKPKAQVSIERFRPSKDPTKLTSLIATVDENDSSKYVTKDENGQPATFVVDVHGRVKEGSFAFGKKGPRVIFKRVAEEGALFSKPKN